jgi:hypothetical protein
MLCKVVRVGGEGKRKGRKAVGFEEVDGKFAAMKKDSLPK